MHNSVQLDFVRSAVAYGAFAAAFFFIMTVVALGQTIREPVAPAADLAHPVTLCSLAEPGRFG